MTPPTRSGLRGWRTRQCNRRELRSADRPLQTPFRATARWPRLRLPASDRRQKRRPSTVGRSPRWEFRRSPSLRERHDHRDRRRRIGGRRPTRRDRRRVRRPRRASVSTAARTQRTSSAGPRKPSWMVTSSLASLAPLVSRWSSVAAQHGHTPEDENQSDDRRNEREPLRGWRREGIVVGDVDWFGYRRRLRITGVVEATLRCRPRAGRRRVVASVRRPCTGPRA